MSDHWSNLIVNHSEPIHSINHNNAACEKSFTRNELVMKVVTVILNQTVNLAITYGYLLQKHNDGMWIHFPP